MLYDLPNRKKQLLSHLKNLPGSAFGCGMCLLQASPTDILGLGLALARQQTVEWGHLSRGPLAHCRSEHVKLKNEKNNQSYSVRVLPIRGARLLSNN